MERILRLATPFIIYLVAEVIFSLVILGTALGVISGTTSVDAGVKTVVDMPMMLFGACTVIFLFLWMKDREQDGYEGNEMSKPMWLVLPVIGLVFALGEIYAVCGMLNRELSEVFFGVSEYAMEAFKQLPTFFLAIVILRPVCFEFLLRGMFHQRLREESGPIPTIVIVGIASILLYRSVDLVLMSVILSIVYEYYRNLAAPLIVSVSYSIGCFMFYAMSGSLPGLSGDMNLLVPLMMLICVAGVGFCVFMIFRKHNNPYGSKW